MGTHSCLRKASALTQQEGDNKDCPYQSFADDIFKHIVECSSILTRAYVHMSEGLPAGSVHESDLMACVLYNAAQDSSLQDTGESRIVQVQVRLESIYAGESAVFVTLLPQSRDGHGMWTGVCSCPD